MIAIPVKTNKENSAVSPLFGKAKWFAIVDDKQITIEENKTQSGREVVENFKKQGVTKVIFAHMGGNPFMLLQKAKIECYAIGDERVLLQDMLKQLQAGKLVKVDTSNMEQYVEVNEKQHQHHNH